MKNGILRENGELIFYKDDVPYHAGAIEIDGDIYYVGRHGRVAVGQHVVHGEMTNGLLSRGTYTFSDDGKLVKNSYIAPKRITESHGTKSKKRKPAKNHGRFRLSKRKLALLAGVLAAVLILFGCAMIVDSISHHKDGASQQEENNEIVLPDFQEPVNLCTVVAQKVYDKEISMSQLGESEPYLPFVFEYRIKETDGVLTLSENADMSKGREFILSKFDTKLEIDNLKTGTTYYYQVQVGEETYKGSFETAQGTRFVYIPGGYNTRDIGGYKTRDGKTIKQGMIIRGTELDGLCEASYYLSQKDVPEVLEQLGFVYDMDLRHSSVASGNYTSVLGADVRHKFYNAPMYLNAFTEDFRSEMKAIFSDLAKEENYPMYMHCTYGADRTGTVVYLLQGLLGVSEEDMVREYQLTGFFSKEYSTSTRMDSVMEEIEKFPGETTSQKIEYFLINQVGLEKSQIDSIKSILLE